MAIHPFSYTEVQIDPSPAFPQGTTSKRPLLNVTLIYGAARVSCFAGVDSMADYTIFPNSVMASLGIDPSIALPGNLVGVGAQPKNLFCSVEIEVENFLRATVLAGFTEDLDGWGIGLLGQNGFFDCVKTVSFDFHGGTFKVET